MEGRVTARQARQLASGGEGHFPEHFAEDDGVGTGLGWQWLAPVIVLCRLPYEAAQPWGPCPPPALPGT